MKTVSATPTDATAQISAVLDLLATSPALSLAVAVAVYAVASFLINNAMGPRFH